MLCIGQCSYNIYIIDIVIEAPDEKSQRDRPPFRFQDRETVSLYVERMVLLL